MIKKIFFALLIVAGFTSVQAEEGRLLRFPATNGSDIVFSFAGDLYTVPFNGGTAVRLTAFRNGYEAFARFSPDGNKIAFTGQYDGNSEVYVMNKNGGEPKRISFTATNSRDDMGDRMGPNNIVMSWTPDGKGIVFRNRIDDGFSGQLWIAPTDGSMASQIPLPEGGWCSYSPDGKRLAYNRVMREFRTWKYYKGGMADDIWIYDQASKKVTNITNNVAQDIMPMWIGDEIYFISDRDKTMNIFVYNTKTKATAKVTNFTDYDVKFPSCGGGKIVFENSGYIYTLDPSTKKYQKITVELNHEGLYARNERKNVSKFITSMALSSNGSRVAITARGDIFDVPAQEGVIKNTTRTPGIYERNAKWSADDKYIAYISDKTGESELWLKPTNGGDDIQLTSGNDSYISYFTWSHNSKKILYTDLKNRIVMVDVATKTKKILLQNGLGARHNGFSPNDEWIVYTNEETNDFSTIKLLNIETGENKAVTERWYNSSSPIFSSDGKYLIFSSDRDFNPIYSRVEWNFAYQNMGGLYIVPLSVKTPSPFMAKDDKVAGEKKEAKAEGDAKGKKAEAEKMAIDFDGIAERIIRVPNLNTGMYSPIYCDGSKIIYNGAGGTNIYDFSKQKSDVATSSRMVGYSADGKKALFSNRGKLYITRFPQGKVSLDEATDVSELYCDIDYSQEWTQIFNEAWRAYRDGFYLENMHGVDWKAIHDKYAVLLPYVKHRFDLTYVIGGMIGELACGHAYVDGGDAIRYTPEKMGMLGAKISRSGDYYRIDEILKGAPYRPELRAPLTEPGLNVKEGDYILAIDGISTATTNNIYSLLRGKAGVLTELTINSKASLEGARKIVIKPIDNEYPLYHYKWVQHNINYVSEKTGGKVGYIYIPDMGPEGLNEFARYFYPQTDKEALIVDDRANGGGNISPMVIERLLREPYRMTMYRNNDKNGTIPDRLVHGPKVLLVNKYSASDGDLFPWSFKKTGLGKVIGTRSWGGIIGISGSLPYIDGTDIRVPFFTNYDASTGEWFVENHGVDPDILIDNDPILEQKGIDQQLDKAIEVILEELKNRKPLPSTPKPRTLKDLGVNE